jgi:hypothetical protein
VAHRREWAVVLGQVRGPMLAGLVLATLGAGLALLLGPAEWAPPVDSAQRALGLFRHDSFPSLAGTALLAVAAADPQVSRDASPSPRVATASTRNPTARANWGE